MTLIIRLMQLKRLMRCIGYVFFKSLLSSRRGFSKIPGYFLFTLAFTAGTYGLVLGSAGCGSSGTSGHSCSCSTNEECPDDYRCDGCYCVPRCTGPEDCTEELPNCDPETGICVGPCEDFDDCTDPAFPNCGADGSCKGPCASHNDCGLPEYPNCSLDPQAEDHGLCLPPCETNGDCESELYPICHPITGTCGAPCTGDDDCPDSGWKCDTDLGICVAIECTQDNECDPPNTVCEDWICVDGCLSHEDCDEGDRCDLVTPGHMYHCEPRDCLSDDDCDPPDTVCDTDGLAHVSGGGYCLSGCETYLDCGMDDYECNQTTGTCGPRDYGDIGLNCSGGCENDFCLHGMGNVCTAYCCRQHDCPTDWGCRPYDDGTGEGHTVKVCVPLEASQGRLAPGETCSGPEDCRSNICHGGTCRETCCTHEDCGEPFFTGLDCRSYTGTTACIEKPVEGTDPIGALGCATTGTPSDCRSDMCFTYFIPDTDCTDSNDCMESRPTCWDYPGAGVDGVNDCVKDICVGHCCSSDDCPDNGDDKFFCGKWVFGSGDFNLCLLHEGDASLLEGEACESNSDCRSNFCSSTGECRKRCCTKADCTDPLRSRCVLEEHTVHSVTRWLTVCAP